MALKILLTGATGFVGKALVAELVAHGYVVRALVRNRSTELEDNVDQVVIDDLVRILEAHSETFSAIENALSEVDVVIHTAARVHVMQDTAKDPLREHRLVNRDVSIRLAEIARKQGVRRFVYLSSIKVNGETSKPGRPFSPEDSHVPVDPYGLSKYEAELGLLSLASKGGMDAVIIRPPLVYGPGVKANFESMMHWISKGIPLPLGAIKNQRSLVAIDNLISFIKCCANLEKSRAASNQVFLISDGVDVSTTVLIKKVAHALGKTPRLIPVPVWFLSGLANVVGKSTMIDRLLSNLQIDSSKASTLLGWQPVVTMDEQLKSTAAEYLKRTQNGALP